MIRGEDRSMETRPVEGDYVRIRIANACDSCKARKVKCDGKTPCGYCRRRQRGHLCHFTPQQRRRRQQSEASSTASVPPQSVAYTPAPLVPPADQAQQTPQRPESRLGDPAVDEEAEVPRDARLLRDAQGKLIFIGDCAPLSFFQSVRQLITTRVDEDAFAPESSRYSVLENASPPSQARPDAGPPLVAIDSVHDAVTAYLCVTAGLVDLFDNSTLRDDIRIWASQGMSADEATNVVKYLVLAIGLQKTQENTSRAYFDYARDRALASLSGNVSTATVQSFLLITMYMLSACQINGAFLFVGLAVRAAYSTGIHRTEVNLRFGPVIHRQRDQLWRSLRVVDLFLSASMGRPPGTSDVDCTVSYKPGGGPSDPEVTFTTLVASAQIFLIVESIVVEVYSLRKITLQLTEGISRQLREWSGRWLQKLKDITTSPARGVETLACFSGASQALSTYYYAVMLVSRPFLMYEVRRRIPDGSAPRDRAEKLSGKSRLADACIEAASLMVDLVADLIERDIIREKMPLVVSWLFASSLALGVGLLGSYGRVLEAYTRRSIMALEHFAKSDAHAMQYSLIANSLLNTALRSLEKREAAEKLQRTENSSQLFGLRPADSRSFAGPPTKDRAADSLGPPSSGKIEDTDPLERASAFSDHQAGMFSPDGLFGDLDPAFLSLSGSLPRTPEFSFLNGGQDDDQAFGAFNLFPLLETGGHIDLAHHF